MNIYLNGMRQYAKFSGRSSRKEFWLFKLIMICMFAGCLLLDGVLGTKGLIFSVTLLIHLVPQISMMVRRLHDSGHSGGWLFLIFVPFLGPITLLVWYCYASEPGPNRYGPSVSSMVAAPAV